MPVKSILTDNVNIICLYQLLLVNTAIATNIEILYVQYLQTVIAHRSVVNAETLTDLLVDLTINIDIERSNAWHRMFPFDVGSGEWCDFTRQFNVSTSVHAQGTVLIGNICSHTTVTNISFSMNIGRWFGLTD